MKKRNISRRKFMGEAACAAVGSTTFLSTLLNLSMVNSLTASSAKFNNDYKALVCVQLLGGNDSFNMLVPTDTNGYNNYSNARSSLALNHTDLLQLNGGNLGLHPSMMGLQDLYNNQQNVAFLCNTGALVEPLANVTDYNNSLKQKPLGMYSHLQQRHHWHTSIPQEQGATGWGGRLADIMNNLNSSQNISMNISLGGKNIFQVGDNTIEYTISRNGIESIRDIFNTDMGFLNLLQNGAVDSMLTQSYSNIFKQTYASQMKTTRDSNRFFEHALEGVSPFTTVFSDTYLSRDLHMVAKVIAAQAALGMNRQTFFVNLSGWDTHDNLLSRHASKLTELNDAFVEFNSALGEINRQNEVTTFTVSDFGRTITLNGSGGTDHAWGGHQIVMGGAVNGGSIYGTYPDLDLSANPLNVSSRGRFIPSISTDEFFAELAIWFGVAESDLVDIFPNICNFYAANCNRTPIGFMNI